ncbi:hypothetical protein BDZ89DRAFT_197131 [Hymenopellis radicata]|nr:hypothetical protein BDZ89DRAFT_197131 [Hymenopellis radicata]
MFALTTAVLAILCKQWIREHHRELPAHSYQEKFPSPNALRVPSLLESWRNNRDLAASAPNRPCCCDHDCPSGGCFHVPHQWKPEGYNVERADVLPCAFKSTQSWLFLKAVLVFQRFIRNISVKYDSWTSTDHPIIERPANPQLRESSFARYLCSGLGWIDEHVSIRISCLIYISAFMTWRRMISMLSDLLEETPLF